MRDTLTCGIGILRGFQSEETHDTSKSNTIAPLVSPCMYLVHTKNLSDNVQESKSKYCVEQEFLPLGSLQLVYHMHGKKQNEEISGD